MPQDGNCTKTLAHLDPYKRGEKPPCDASAPDTCQVGDLAGKHGNVTDSQYEAEYVDPYISLREGDKAFFGNLSFVFHFGNTTRITCANFAKVDAASDQATGNSTSRQPLSSSPVSAPVASGTGVPGSSGSAPGSSASTSPFPGSAASTRLSLPLVLVSAAALVFAL